VAILRDAEIDLNGEQVVMTTGLGAEWLRLTVVLPSHYMYIPDQHHHMHISSSDEDVIYVPPFDIPDARFDWELPVEARGTGEAMLHLEGQVFFCPVSDPTICIWATIDECYRVKVEEGSRRHIAIVHEVDILDTMEGGSSSEVAHESVEN
jgi:hypothetical protein